MTDDPPRQLPSAARRAMWALRAGLGVAAIGIIGFFLSYGQVGAPELAAADYHPLPMGAWLSILAWCGGMIVAVAAGWRVRGLARRYAEGREADDQEVES